MHYKKKNSFNISARLTILKSEISIFFVFFQQFNIYSSLSSAKTLFALIGCVFNFKITYYTIFQVKTVIYGAASPATLRQPLHKSNAVAPLRELRSQDYPIPALIQG